MSYEDPFSADSQALIGFAKSLAEWLHRGQVDKSGEPYFQHPWRVLGTLAIDDAPYTWQAAAVLHDVTEDTNVEYGDLLRLGIPYETAVIVKLLDRNYSKDVYGTCAYWDEKNRGTDEETDYCEGARNAEEFYYFQIRQNPGALAVKLADIRDNLLDWRLESLDEKTQKRLRKKYARALELLSD